MSGEALAHAGSPSAALASAGPSATALIDGLYAVQLAKPLPGAGGGLPAFAAIDITGARRRLMAVEARADAPARAGAIDELSGVTIPGLLTPLACGPAPSSDGRAAMFVICPEPPGPSLAADPGATGQPWSETAVIELLLRPVAAALAALEERRVTHRAVRPNNLFRDPANGRVVLGCAWASPPASLQPTSIEPPYSAQCLPAARGEGSIADDVHALGVVMLILATGRPPLADHDDVAAVQRQLELGSFQALCGGARLPQSLSDLLSGMLAEDPQHRPTPSLLADPTAARARRVAKRPARRASQPLLVEGQPVWNTRMLAGAMARHPASATRLVGLGVIDHWLRRHLGDPVVAGKVEDLARAHDGAGDAANPLLLMRVVATLDPLAPLCWNGMMLWPDAVGPMLALEPAAGEKLRQLIEAEALPVWAAMRGEHADPVSMRLLGRSYRAGLRDTGWAGGLARLAYRLNPLLPCRSPLLAAAAVARLRDLLPALEAHAEQGQQAGQPVVDRELVAFLAARQNSLDRDLIALGDNAATPSAALALLRHLAVLQSQQSPRPLPHLARWLGFGAAPLLDSWHHRGVRSDKQRQLGELAAAGHLAALVAVLDDPNGRQEDEAGFAAATAEAARIDRDLAELRQGRTAQAGDARRLSQEIAAALALAALAVRAVAAALG